jgi:oxygen-dependent protoporphyrinogen oxidase
MGELVAALSERLDGVNVRCGESVAAVSRRGSGFRLALAGGEVTEADAVILALPANVTSLVTRPLSPALSAATGLIPFSSSAVVHMAWPRHDVDHPLDGYGYLVPAVEGSLILGCTWSSSKWKGRAPDGTVLMRMNVGRFGRADVGDMNETELIRLCRGEASLTLGIAAEPLMTRVHRWSGAMPQYTRDHPRTLSAIERALADCPGVYLAGCSYRGVGISDCIDSGESAASHALDFLSRGGTVHD